VIRWFDSEESENSVNRLCCCVAMLRRNFPTWLNHFTSNLAMLRPCSALFRRWCRCCEAMLSNLLLLHGSAFTQFRIFYRFCNVSTIHKPATSLDRHAPVSMKRLVVDLSCRGLDDACWLRYRMVSVESHKSET
jgi:hypothetical protein